MEIVVTHNHFIHTLVEIELANAFVELKSHINLEVIKAFVEINLERGFVARW